MTNITIAILQISGGFLVLIYWIYFFFVENKSPERNEVYLAFERSFVLGDIFWVTPCLLISGFCILFNQPVWVFFSIAGGSALVFLFSLDFSFNLLQGNYKQKTSGNYIEIVINILSFVFGLVFMIFGFVNI